MLVCVIGCTGYLGSKISSRLHNKGHKVIGVCRKFPKNNKKFKNNFYKIIEGDITKPTFQNKIFKNLFSAIVYTVSLNHKISEVNLNNSIRVNYLPLLNICNIISKKKLKSKIIYFSTMQVYGNYNKEKIISEKTKKNCKNIYALTHSMCEDILEIYSNFGNITSTSLRLSNGYGYPELKTCNCWWLVVNDFCSNVEKKNRITLNSDGSPLRDFIHISDIANSVEKLLTIKKKLPKIMNLCSGKTTSMLEIAAIVKKKSSKINKKPDLYLKDEKLSEKDLTKKISILKNKQKFRIDNSEMKKFKLIPEINLSKGIEKTLIDLKKKKN